MRKSGFLLVLVAAFAMPAFFAGCGSSPPPNTGHTEDDGHDHGDHEGHDHGDHEGHDHDGDGHADHDAKDHQ